MITVDRVLRCIQPPGRALDFVCDFENLPSWDAAVVRVAARGDGGLTIGAKYDVDLRFEGIASKICYTMTGYEPGQWATLSGISQTYGVSDTISVSTEGAETRIRYRVEVRLFGPYRLLEPVIRPRFDRYAHAAFRVLQQKLGDPLPSRRAPHSANAEVAL